MNKLFISGSGHIEFEEFVTVFTSCFQPPSEHELLEAFHAFDRDGDGFLTEEEVKGVLKNAKQPATNRNVSEMIKSVDTNGDGKINYKGNYARSYTVAAIAFTITANLQKKTMRPSAFLTK